MERFATVSNDKLHSQLASCISLFSHMFVVASFVSTISSGGGIFYFFFPKTFPIYFFAKFVAPPKCFC